MFIIENYPSKIMIMSFWAPAPKSPAENGIPTKALGTSMQKYVSDKHRMSKLWVEIKHLKEIFL